MSEISGSSGRGYGYGGRSSGYGSGYGRSGYGSYGSYGGGAGNYYYGGYNYGGGYGGGDSAAMGRSLKDYLLILRERVWYFIMVFFIVMVATFLYTFNLQTEYLSSASIQLLRDDPDLIGRDIEMDQIAGIEDFNTQVQVLSSVSIIQAVADRIKDEDRERFMEPYETSLYMEEKSVPEILAENRSIQPVRMSMVVRVSYRHADPELAQRIANYFAEEFVAYNIRLNIDTSMMAVEDLRVRVEQQREKVEDIRSEIAEYRERENRISLNPEENIEIQELQNINMRAVESKTRLDELESQWRLVEEAEAEGRDLYELPFIASLPRVQNLLSERSTQRINIESLKKRYREKHPAMIQAMRSFEQTETELNEALQDAVNEMEMSVQQARSSYNQASQRLAAMEREILDLNRAAVAYKSLEDNLLVNQNLYQHMEMQLREQMARIALQGANARIIDRAIRPIEPSFPNYPMLLGGGAFLGLFLGVSLVFLIAFLDDRIKSSYDIETAVGLPLIGIVPRIKRMNSSEKAQAVASNRERRITESFRAIHSALRINETSKAARTILVTSTSPSEGKSFVVTNLALTYAVHGERTLIIDCDLRMPNIGKSIALSPDTKGVTHYFKHEVALNDAIVRDVYPNLDVLTAGKRAENPTQVLTSPAFEQMIDELVDKYDRVIIDSPPIAAVSDVLTILPYVDGLIYVIKFNAVKRKTAKSNLRRILESNTPVFGAVLNQISTAIASYYYSSYYDKSYNDYYNDAPVEQNPEELTSSSAESSEELAPKS